MKLYFVRHGETSYNRQERIQGTTDIPLNENGLAQAAEAADYFKEAGIAFKKVYTSPRIRAQKTASVVSGFDMDQVIVDERLIELHFGKIEGMVYYDAGYGFMAMFKKPEDYVIPEEGESFEALFKRAASFMEDMAELDRELEEDDCVLIATHGAALRALLAVIQNTPVKDFWIKGITNCSIVPVHLEDGNWQVGEIINPVKKTAFMSYGRGSVSS